jgi:hypothetical protein
MTCPSCGTIAAGGVERCPRCRGSLAVPTHQPSTPIPVVRAPTNRGELSQRAAGIVAVSLVPPPAGGQPAPIASAPRPAAIGGPAPAPAPRPLGTPPSPAPAPYVPPARYAGHAPVSAPYPPAVFQSPPAPSETNSTPAPQATWAQQPPPPPAYPAPQPQAQLPPPAYAPPVYTPPDAAAAHRASRVEAAPTAPEAADVTRHGAAHQRDEQPDEAHRHAGRSNADASWPPPPGPWTSGQPARES